MQGHYWIINIQLLGLFLFSLFPIQGFAGKLPLVNILDKKAFNQLWDKECRDTGERPLEPYLVSPASLTPKYSSESKRRALFTDFFSHGQVVIVSDNFYRRGIKCYRRYNLKRIIVKKGKNYPLLFASRPRSLYNHNISSIYADFLSSYLDRELYVTQYWSSLEESRDDREIYYTFFHSNKNLLGFEYDGTTRSLSILNFLDLGKNILSKITIDFTGEYPRSFRSYFPDGTLYKFTEKGLMIKRANEKQFYFSGKSYKAHQFSPKNGFKRQIKFIPSSLSNKKNINDLSEILGKNWNYFLGLHASDNKYHVQNKKWLLNWINEKGYLTQENGKKVFLPNRKRLKIWLTRYLKKRHVTLKKGTTYYFSRDLSHYLIMDFYKENGQPIFSQHPENPCKRYEHLDPSVCKF